MLGIKIDLQSNLKRRLLPYPGRRGKWVGKAMQNKMNPNQIVLDAHEIDQIIKKMADEILEKHDKADIALIGIHTRGVFLAKRLRKLLRRSEGQDIPFGEIDITLYRDDWTQMSAQPLVKITNIPFSVEGRKILLVDDVLFTGRTIRAAMDALIDFGRPARIELAVLVDRGHRELPIQSNYTGYTVATERSQMVTVLLKEHDGEDKVVVE
jgi:pyrimidine operon attenuation protein/uracil phosphoribosyltransferase